MSFTTNDGEFISLSDASSWTANHRNSSNYNGVKAQFYGKAKVGQILAQQGCTGLRVYYALDAQNAPVLILIGTDSSGNDLETSLILERGTLCPPNCGTADNLLQG